LTRLQGQASFIVPAGDALLAHLAEEFAICLVMPIAMMLPFMGTQIRLVALSSYAVHRSRAIRMFMGGFVGVWLLAMTVLMTCLHLMYAVLGQLGTVAITCVLATMWQATHVRRIALRRCAFTTSLRADPSIADQDCARFGRTIAWASVVSCTGLMGMAMAGGSFAAMALLVPVQFYDGSQRRPTWWVSCLAVGCISVVELMLVAASS
jgi:hypothetical protein